jgi:hypothetical protein
MLWLFFPFLVGRQGRLSLDGTSALPSARRLMEKNNMGRSDGDAACCSIQRYKKHFWAVYDGSDLVCVTVYKKGAAEVIRRLQGIQKEKPSALNPIT